LGSSLLKNDVVLNNKGQEALATDLTSGIEPENVLRLLISLSKIILDEATRRLIIQPGQKISLTVLILDHFRFEKNILWFLLFILFHFVFS
jgi:hypothetical protein